MVQERARRVVKDHGESVVPSRICKIIYRANRDLEDEQLIFSQILAV